MGADEVSEGRGAGREEGEGAEEEVVVWAGEGGEAVGGGEGVELLVVRKGLAREGKKWEVRLGGWCWRLKGTERWDQRGCEGGIIWAGLHWLLMHQ